MSKRIIQTQGQVCQLCDFIGARSLRRQQTQFRILSPLSRQFHTRGKLPLQNTKSTKAQAIPVPTYRVRSQPAPREKTVSQTRTTQQQIGQALAEARSAHKALIVLNRIPSDEETLFALQKLDNLAQLIASYDGAPMKGSGAVSSLLHLESKSTTKKQSLHKFATNLQPTIEELSELAYTIVKHPPVFISPQALQLYTQIQTTVQKPQSLPEIFHLYANKDLPTSSKPNSVTYKSQNPNKVGNAIPLPTANLALDSAILTEHLPTAIDLIETSYSTTSFRRAKLVRKALLPFTGLAVAPVAAYTIASQLASMQSTMDTQLATNVAFTGLVAYIGFTATIGIVAITTANDQMERVTWSQGMPLRERWIREEERAAIDKVAQAWGFNEVWRRGEEEGSDWDVLREWISQRGMILDAAELMEGME